MAVTKNVANVTMETSAFSREQRNLVHKVDCHSKSQERKGRTVRNDDSRSEGRLLYATI